ncbi:hypothetical protein KBB89_00955 [Candidatus Gracilibacteria bacterium]|nr:hypothetical protein [Candidatus Gracilibacteria bacterium]
MNRIQRVYLSLIPANSKPTNVVVKGILTALIDDKEFSFEKKRTILLQLLKDWTGLDSFPEDITACIDEVSSQYQFGIREQLENSRVLLMKYLGDNDFMIIHRETRGRTGEPEDSRLPTMNGMPIYVATDPMFQEKPYIRTAPRYYEALQGDNGKTLDD